MATDWSANWRGYNNGVKPPPRVSYVVDAPTECYVARDYSDADRVLFNAIGIREAELVISTWGHESPDKAYVAGDVPRAAKYLESNTLSIGSDCKQPAVAIRCSLVGITPSEANPIHWRLEAGHVFCRRRGSGRPPTEERVFREWRGVAHTDTFTLFDEETDDVLYERPDGSHSKTPPKGPVVGGHHVLTVAAKPEAIEFWVRDVVHIRVIGSNPGAAAYEPIIDGQLSDLSVPADCRPSLRNILIAELEQEVGSNLPQFSATAQTQSRYDGTLFTWPPDPELYPITTFDFGIGVGQLTSAGYATRDIFWDWGLNSRVAAWIMFYEKLHAKGHGWLMSPATATDWVIGLWMCEDHNWSGLTPKPTAAELDAHRKIADDIREHDGANDREESERKAAQKEYDAAKKAYDDGDKTKREAYEKAKAESESAAATATAKKAELDKVNADTKSTPEAKAAAQKAFDEAEKKRKEAQTAYTNAKAAYPPVAKYDQETQELKAAEKQAADAKAEYDGDENAWNALVNKWKAAFIANLPKTWRNLAITGWYAYNGSGPGAVTHTRHVEGRPHGKIDKVPHTLLPAAMQGAAGKALLASLDALNSTESTDTFTSEWLPLRDDEQWLKEVVCTPEGELYDGLLLFEFKPKIVTY